LQRLQELPRLSISAEPQQVQRAHAEYTNLHMASGFLLRCYSTLSSKWPGKLLAGNTIAACFRPAVLLMWQVMGVDAAMVSRCNSGSSADAHYPTDAVAITAWTCDNAGRVFSEIAHQALSHGLASLPQQTIKLLAEPTLYQELGVALGELAYCVWRMPRP
jgi:hypothetical protein